MTKIGPACKWMASLHSPPLHLSTSTEPLQGKVVQTASPHTSCYEAPVCPRPLLLLSIFTSSSSSVQDLFCVCWSFSEENSCSFPSYTKEQYSGLQAPKYFPNFTVMFEWLLHIPTFSLVRSAGAQQCQRDFAVIVTEVQLSQKPDGSRERSGETYLREAAKTSEDLIRVHTLQLYPTHSTHWRLRPEEQRRPSSTSASYSSQKRLGTRTEEWNPLGITEEPRALKAGEQKEKQIQDAEQMGSTRTISETKLRETGGCQPYKRTATMEEQFQSFASQQILDIYQKVATHHLQLF